MKKIVSLMLVFACLSAISAGCANEVEYYVICNPKSYVCVRNEPKKGSDEAGRFDCGDYVISDGIEKNGYMHIPGGFESDGWIYKGNLVADRPVIEKQTMRINSNWKVICRRCVAGKKIRTLSNGDTVTVYAQSAEWAVTDKGYIRTEFLEVDE